MSASFCHLRSFTATSITKSNHSAFLTFVSGRPGIASSPIIHRSQSHFLCSAWTRNSWWLRGHTSIDGLLKVKLDVALVHGRHALRLERRAVDVAGGVHGALERVVLPCCYVGTVSFVFFISFFLSFPFEERKSKTHRFSTSTKEESGAKKKLNMKTKNSHPKT